MDLCLTCLTSFPNNRQACVRCGVPLNGVAKNEKILCGRCLVSRSYIDMTVAPYLYEFPVPHIVTSLKFGGHQKYGRLMGQLIADCVVKRYGESLPGLLIPVPIHRDRWEERGFNQAAIIARYCGSSLGIQVEHAIVQRVVNTVSQTELSRSRRRKNMRRAFNIKETVKCSHVAIIDDVMTTGSTVSELARLLKKSGVSRVDVWVFGRTPIV